MSTNTQAPHIVVTRIYVTVDKTEEKVSTNHAAPHIVVTRICVTVDKTEEKVSTNTQAPHIVVTSYMWHSGHRGKSVHKYTSSTHCSH